MIKDTILGWLAVSVYFILLLLMASAYAFFGETSYFVLSGLLLLVGMSGAALSLSCRDRITCPRLVLFLVVTAGGALFVAMPFV